MPVARLRAGLLIRMRRGRFAPGVPSGPRGGGVPGDAVTEIVTQRPPQGATGGDVTHRGPRPFAARTIEELRRRGRSTGRTVDPEVAGSSPVEPAIRINNVGAVMSRALGVSVTVLAS